MVDWTVVACFMQWFCDRFCRLNKSFFNKPKVPEVFQHSSLFPKQWRSCYLWWSLVSRTKSSSLSSSLQPLRIATWHRSQILLRILKPGCCLFGVISWYHPRIRRSSLLLLDQPPRMALTYNIMRISNESVLSQMSNWTLVGLHHCFIVTAPTIFDFIDLSNDRITAWQVIFEVLRARKYINRIFFFADLERWYKNI